jgi:hypothetical protein
MFVKEQIAEMETRITAGFCGEGAEIVGSE